MGSAPHGDYTFGGPVVIALAAILALVALTSFWTLISILRRGDRFSSALSRCLWALPQVAYLAVVVWWLLARGAEPAVSALLAMLLAAPLAQVLYVLRVVSPRPDRSDTDLGARDHAR